MSQLKIKVLGLVYVDETTAKTIDKMMSDDTTRKNNPYVRTKKWSGYLSEISGILHESGSIGGKQNTVENLIEEYNKWRKQNLAISPEIRGKNLQMFCLLYGAMTGKFNEKPRQELQDNAIEVQTKFFKENKYRCNCDLYLLTEILKEYKVNKLVGIYSGAVFRILERQVYEDMRCAKYQH